MTTLVKRILSVAAVAAVTFSGACVWAAEGDPQKGMTLLEIIKSGGIVMVILLLLSVAGVGLIIYNFMTLKREKLAPEDFAAKAIEKLKKGEVAEVRKLCKAQDCLMSQMVLVGLDRKSSGGTASTEAMETFIRKELARIWQNLGYLTDIANIAPLLGLLGTVLGMIEAFNAVTMHSSAAKAALLASGISKAMVNTAGGLFIAIGIMIFYSYFKGMIQDIVGNIESQAGDLVKLIEKL